jgi:hypothetical protein
MFDPKFASKAVQEARTAGEWLVAQFNTVWHTHKVAVGVIFLCGAVFGCVVHG